MKNKKNLSVIMLGILIVIIDRITKLLLINKEITIIPNLLNFTYIENNGVAFGIASNNTILIVLLNVIVSQVALQNLLLKIYSLFTHPVHFCFTEFNLPFY